mmetsp:Transcript_22493/g.56242  ORF Transcript_22493/g.56242 Transcript_22493/m.56242 type:complete len:237 (-) Transcript_22493:186-896(-)
MLPVCCRVLRPLVGAYADYELVPSALVHGDRHHRLRPARRLAHELLSRLHPLGHHHPELPRDRRRRRRRGRLLPPVLRLLLHRGGRLVLLLRGRLLVGRHRRRPPHQLLCHRLDPARDGARRLGVPPLLVRVLHGSDDRFPRQDRGGDGALPGHLQKLLNVVIRPLGLACDLELDHRAGARAGGHGDCVTLPRRIGRHDLLPWRGVRGDGDGHERHACCRSGALLPRLRRGGRRQL